MLRMPLHLLTATVLAAVANGARHSWWHSHRDRPQGLTRPLLIGVACTSSGPYSLIGRNEIVCTPPTDTVGYTSIVETELNAERQLTHEA